MSDQNLQIIESGAAKIFALPAQDESNGVELVAKGQVCEKST